MGHDNGRDQRPTVEGRAALYQCFRKDTDGAGGLALWMSVGAPHPACGVGRHERDSEASMKAP